MKTMSKKLPPKIVFLDAGTVDLGDIQLSALKKLGNLVLYNDTRPEDIHTRAYGASVVITNKCVFNQAIFEKLPDLQLICVAATGVNNIDLEIAKNKGVMVANAANYSTATVVEHTLLFILGFAHRLVEHHQSVIDRRWSNGRQFAIFDYPYSEVSGKTLGVIGYGNIGKKVAAAAKALGMNVLIAKLPNRKYPASPARLPLEQVLKQSDFVTLHCTLTEDTRHLMNTKRLNIMKRS
ncbi:MAG: glycerate dehydrogenase, partial [Deltaproteobacteria bacterium]|nr:glycerate dehydrogenase [Deltaproteobacteria bacterium]